jgi:hypothetical protein
MPKVKKKAQKTSVPAPPQQKSNVEETLKVAPKETKPVVNENQGEPCIKCAKPVPDKEIKLRCQHWTHQRCLKE